MKNDYNILVWFILNSLVRIGVYDKLIFFKKVIIIITLHFSWPYNKYLRNYIVIFLIRLKFELTKTSNTSLLSIIIYTFPTDEIARNIF